jgi:hypothetical protein
VRRLSTCSVRSASTSARKRPRTVSSSVARSSTRDRRAHTDFRDGIARRDNFFSYNSKVAAMPRLNDGIIGPTCCSWHQAGTGLVRAFDSIHLPFPLLTRPCFFIA